MKSHWIPTVVIVVMITTTPCLADWTEFRGPTGQGHADATNVPLKWSETENVAWKTELPGKGWSSPVMSDGQIWLTTATDAGRSLRAICVDESTGDVLSNIEVVRDNVPKSIHSKNSHASPTAVIDGPDVYVHFGTYTTARIRRRDGHIRWKSRLEYEPQHGPGGSPILFEDLLIVNCDGTDEQYVVALNKQTGEIVWKTHRAHISQARLNGEKSPPMAFSTPLLIRAGNGYQVISAGSDHVAAYDARTGKELWWSRYNGYSVVPRPVHGHGMVFVSSCFDGPILYAIRLGGRGDVTESHVQWTLERGAPHNPSPLIVGDEIYLVNDRGIATYLDARTGKRYWKRRLGGQFSASPIFADDRVYFLNEECETTVVRPGTSYDELAKNQMSGRTLASMAVADGVIFLRTDRHLYRIESK